MRSRFPAVLLGGLLMGAAAAAAGDPHPAEPQPGAPHPPRSAAAPTATRAALPLVPSPPIAADFRLRVSDNGHYLVDQEGAPFLWIGDTGWSLLQSLSLEEARRYLENRRRKGYNVVQCVLAQDWRDVPRRGVAATQPSWLDDDPATPNPAFFAHVDRVLEVAQGKGIVLGLLPAWGDLVVTRRLLTTANARAYGKWLGGRYRDTPNIVWILGGDQPPTGFEAVFRELAAGLREGDGGRHLITYHPRGQQTSADHLHDEPWLDLNMIQSGHGIDLPNYAMVLADYGRRPVKPTLDGEPRYEHIIDGLRQQGPRIDAHQARKAAYNAVLSGACGHTYGCSEVFRFWRPGDGGPWAPDTPWTEAMDFPGALHMGYLKALLLSLPWPALHPEPALVVAGQGAGGTYVPAALSADRDLALLYLPEAQTVTVDLTLLSADRVRATWYDPRDGRFSAAGSLASGPRRFVPPPGDPDPDYVLLLEAAAPDRTPPAVEDVVAVTGVTALAVRFSERVASASAEKTDQYALGEGTAVRAAALAGDGRTVILRTDGLGPGRRQTLRVHGIEDLARPPNRMAAAAVEFRLQKRPAAARLVAACRASQAVTVEAWVKPADATQTGPARVVSLSRDPGARNVTLGQAGSAWVARLRTTATSANGLPEIRSGPETAAVRLTHVVFVRAPSGVTTLYVDGVPGARAEAGGDLSNWAPDHALVLANEATGDRPWRGQLRLVRIYSRALEDDEVLARFLEGPAPADAGSARW